MSARIIEVEHINGEIFKCKFFYCVDRNSEGVDIINESDECIGELLINFPYDKEDIAEFKESVIEYLTDNNI